MEGNLYRVSTLAGPGKYRNLGNKNAIIQNGDTVRHNMEFTAYSEKQAKFYMDASLSKLYGNPVYRVDTTVTLVTPGPPAPPTSNEEYYEVLAELEQARGQAAASMDIERKYNKLINREALERESLLKVKQYLDYKEEGLLPTREPDIDLE